MARTAVSASPALRLLPTGRSLLVGFGVLFAAAALYYGARETRVFAVHRVVVEPTAPGQTRAIERALGDLDGTSLLRIDQAQIERQLERLPHVHLLSFDRAFPNELRVRVMVERAAAVLRRGSDRWLVSAEGRVLRPLDSRLRRPLPVVWVERSVEPEVGAILAAAEPARAVRILAAIRAADPKLGRQVWYVKTGEGRTTTAVLSDKFELRLGTTSELPLKLAVAGRVLGTLRQEGSVAAYLDVSVPERPVVGTSLESQVEPETASSDAALTAE